MRSLWQKLNTSTIIRFDCNIGDLYSYVRLRCIEQETEYTKETLEIERVLLTFVGVQGSRRYEGQCKFWWIFVRFYSEFFNTDILAKKSVRSNKSRHKFFPILSFKTCISFFWVKIEVYSCQNSTQNWTKTLKKLTLCNGRFLTGFQAECTIKNPQSREKKA